MFRNTTTRQPGIFPPKRCCPSPGRHPIGGSGRDTANITWLNYQHSRTRTINTRTSIQQRTVWLKTLLSRYVGEWQTPHRSLNTCARFLLRSAGARLLFTRAKEYADPMCSIFVRRTMYAWTIYIYDGVYTHPFSVELEATFVATPLSKCSQSLLCRQSKPKQYSSHDALQCCMQDPQQPVARPPESANCHRI